MAMSFVTDELRPSFSSVRVIVIWSVSTMNAEIPRAVRSSKPVRAKSRIVPPNAALSAVRMLGEAGLVEGRYETKVIDGQHIKERHYRITGKGTTTWESAREFWQEVLRIQHEPEGGLAGA